MSIVFFSGSRAEAGLISPVMQSLRGTAEVYLLLGFAHSDPYFGNTGDEIRSESAGNLITLQESASGADDLASAAIGCAATLEAVSKKLADIRPEWTVVYGDRFEHLAFGLGAFLLGIPLIHIEGGDLTEGGTYDDSIRHALTKLASIHVPTSRQAQEVLLQLGEEPWRIRRGGLPAHLEIDAGLFDNPTQILTELSLSGSLPTVLVTWHPLPNNPSESEAGFCALIEATSQLLNKGIQVVWTYPNYDPGSRSFIATLEDMARKEKRLRLVKSLGRKKFRGLLSLGARRQLVFIGNSSAALKECPVFQCFNLDIGTRQKGRVRSRYTVSCEVDAVEITRLAVEFLDFTRAKTTQVPFDDPFRGEPVDAVLRDVLSEAFLPAKLLQKKHYASSYGYSADKR